MSVRLMKLSGERSFFDAFKTMFSKQLSIEYSYLKNSFYLANLNFLHKDYFDLDPVKIILEEKEYPM